MVINYSMSVIDLHWVMQSTYIPLLFWFAVSYIWLEGRKSFFKFDLFANKRPLLMRFYRRAAFNEMHSFHVYFQENLERALRPKMRMARKNMELNEINQSFDKIKLDSLANVNLQFNSLVLSK